MSEFATNDGLMLAYDVAGEGAPLLIISGLSADRAFWSFARPHLTGLRSVAFDNRDIGASSQAPASYRVADMARDALAVLNAAGLERAHVLGHSMGGLIAQELALVAPERVDRLVLCNTLGRQNLYTRDLLALLVRLRTEIADPILYVSTLATFTLGRHTLANVPLGAIAKATVDAGPLQPVAGFTRQAQACADADTLDRIGAIRAPTLVLSSPDDRFFAQSFSDALIAAIPGAKGVEVPQTGHCPMVEAPEVFAAAVRGFLLD